MTQQLKLGMQYLESPVFAWHFGKAGQSANLLMRREDLTDAMAHEANLSKCFPSPPPEELFAVAKHEAEAMRRLGRCTWIRHSYAWWIAPVNAAAARDAEGATHVSLVMVWGVCRLASDGCVSSLRYTISSKPVGDVLMLLRAYDLTQERKSANTWLQEKLGAMFETELKSEYSATLLLEETHNQEKVQHG